MGYSTRERTSHVLRRLGMGAAAELAASLPGPEAAIAAALDLSEPPTTPPDMAAPPDRESARNDGDVETAFRYWLGRMAASPRLVEERLVWFWHDHFATSLRKVRVPYLMWQQHLTVRSLATGSFAELLHAIAVDPAMLLYLDGASNRRSAINENFGREVMELFTLGRGHYTEDDVVAAARAFSGWVVAVPGRLQAPNRVDPWTAVFLPFRHDGGSKTLLGVTGRLDAAAAIDVLLGHPATAEHVAAKLYGCLVGLPADEATRKRLGAAFRRDYSVMALVEAIVADPAFTSDAAVRARVRTPLERAIGIAQGFATSDRAGQALLRGLRTAGYVPWLPPNVAGFPAGERLLDPHRLIHGFDLATLADPRRLGRLGASGLFARLGVFDVDAATIDRVDRAGGPADRLALAVNAPEYLVA